MVISLEIACMPFFTIIFHHFYTALSLFFIILLNQIVGNISGILEYFTGSINLSQSVNINTVNTNRWAIIRSMVKDMIIIIVSVAFP